LSEAALPKKFTFGTIAGGIAPIWNASKARILDLRLLPEADAEDSRVKT
jgi:hypothetical protein